ncbi:Mpped1 [Symbiodinium pilosum]|uniref:Mpped1 protein n=1 Tax=Symbiodinium pilosum TaxID=2952 RepID=A0A812VMG5_SYMPI|nr:Mpped1 [Symbiodinium pilosum]
MACPQNLRPERYAANPRADAEEVAQVQKLLLDQAIELALLGGQQWQYAERKAMVALKDSTDKDALLKLLKDLSDKNYVPLAREAAVLVLREEPERQELSESLSSVLSKHRCCQARDLLDMEYKKYGFLLRALPPVRLKFPEEVEEEAPDAPAAEEATLVPPEAEEAAPEVPAVKLEEVLDSEFLSQLELSRAAAAMQNLAAIQRKRHDISRFKFFDLKQVAVPLLSPDGATLGVYEEIEEPPPADEEETAAAEEVELTDWQKDEATEKEAQAQAFSLLEELLRVLARAAGYAAAREADQLLLASLATALNALLLVAPAPEVCVPKGPKSNPMDIDPDRHVGAEDDAPEEAKEPEQAEEPVTDVWLSLAVMAELAVNAMLRLKLKWAAADPMKAGHDSAAAARRLEAMDEEERSAAVAQIAVKELEAVDEELHDVWFEKVPELDVVSVAKLVAFSVLCLYHMRRWSNIIVLCRGFNDATCSVYATTFLPLMIGAQKEICNLSNRALANTQRYLAESKSTFELLRQLALQGELSEPEQLYRKRPATAWSLTHQAYRMDPCRDGMPRIEAKVVEDPRRIEAKVVEDPHAQPKLEGWTRFVCFSDTHGKHGNIPPQHCPEADVLLHAGDFTMKGEVSQVESFSEWLKEYPAREKIVIAGNHDLTFEPEFMRKHGRDTANCEKARSALAGGCTYLEDNAVEVFGYKIYGSPWQPEFCDWAFNLPRGEPLAQVWSKIPDDTDILMTHGPAQGILDLCFNGLRAGCDDLLAAVRKRRVPVVVCGHIHEAYGWVEDGSTLFVNASTCTLRYRPDHPPIVFDMPPLADLPVRKAEPDALKAAKDSHNLASRAVPAAMEQLRKSRLLLAEFLQDREAFSVAVQRGQLVDTDKEMKERSLRLASSALVSSYRKAVELLRKRQMSDQVVQALHELGNLLWLEGDAGGARDAWSDAVDTVFQFPFAIRNWSKCVEASLSPPQDPARVEILLLTVVILSKHARLTKPKDVMAHLNAALFASNIVEAILTTALPNPPRRDQFALGRHRLREIFFGLRETRMILPPSSVHGGVDGANFLGALSFFQNTLLVTEYQPARCLPVCMLYDYVATDVCRNLTLAIKGRLMAAHSLIRCRSLTEAWLALYAVSRGYDKPRGLMATEALDVAVTEALEITAAQPFRCSEEPASAANVQAVNQLMELTLTGAGAGAVDAEAAPVTGTAAYNLRFFKYLKAEFLIAVCSYQRVFPKLNEPQEKDRLALLDKADALLVEIWKEVTGNDDDREAWSTASRASRESGAEEPAFQDPVRTLTEEEGELCAEVRLMRAKVQEGKGDLGKAIQEVLYGMEFLRRLAVTGTKSSQDCNLGAASSSRLRVHPGSKCWMRLRCYMVNLLVSQGRLQAAAAHIQQGLEETKATQHDAARVELLMSKVKMEVLSGRLLELQGERHLGAIPAAECCLAVAARNLPLPTSSAVYARMMLVNMLQQNPALVQLKRTEETAEALEATGGAEEEELDPSEMLLLEAAGSIIISPIAKELQKAVNKKGTKKMTFHEHQKMFADMVAECLDDVEKLMEVQGVQRAHLHPRNLNSYCDFGPDSSGEEAFKPPPDPPLLPEIKPRFRELSHNDSRELPNVYLQLMPLRLHCQLALADLQLELGEMQEAASSRWWRKLTYRLGLATTSAPLDAPNAILYRDPKTFATGICPATDSPLYRTFMERMKSPQTVVLSEWVPPYERQPEEGLQLYMKEFMGVARLVLKEGGNDLQQLLEFLDEGLEEVLRVEASM